MGLLGASHCSGPLLISLHLILTQHPEHNLSISLVWMRNMSLRHDLKLLLSNRAESPASLGDDGDFSCCEELKCWSGPRPTGSPVRGGGA